MKDKPISEMSHEELFGEDAGGFGDWRAISALGIMLASLAALIIGLIKIAS